MQFLFGHWRLVLDWVVNLPCVLAIMFGTVLEMHVKRFKMCPKIATRKSAPLKMRRFETEKGYRVNLFCCLYSAILLFGT